MPTLRAIAKQTGVSVASVSRVLNNHPSVSYELREKVIAAAGRRRRVGATGRRGAANIAYVYTGEASLGLPFDSAVLEGVHEAMADSDYHIRILELRRTRRQGESFSQLFQRLGVVGAILRTTDGTRGICAEIAEQGLPAVVVGDVFQGYPLAGVCSESRAASREAVDYLISQGHKRIAVCMDLADNADHAQRLAGYLDAMRGHGLAVDDKLVMRIAASRQSGAQIIYRLAGNVDRPTAIYITDPMTAVGAIYEAQKKGLCIPDDLSIIGFDDTDLRHTVLPTMTAVCQDASGLGREAYRMLSELMTGKRTSADASPKAWLELHGSAGPAPAPAPVMPEP